MGSRTWFKIFADKWLEGSMRYESPDIRGIFVDLLALAASGKYGDTGEIKLQNGVGLTDRQFENLLNISGFLWKKTKKLLEETERITVNKANIIKIIHWNKYQSEYERTKKYRTKSAGISTPESNTGEGDTEGEGEGKVQKTEVTKTATFGGMKYEYVN